MRAYKTFFLCLFFEFLTVAAAVDQKLRLVFRINAKYVSSPSIKVSLLMKQDRHALTKSMLVFVVAFLHGPMSMLQTLSYANF